MRENIRVLAGNLPQIRGIKIVYLMTNNNTNNILKTGTFIYFRVRFILCGMLYLQCFDLVSIL